MHLARGLFDVNEVDKWQMAMYIHGVAGSGKSTILSLLKDMYPPEKVGIVMSDAQTTFFDESLYDKWMILCMDADENTTWSRTRFNSCMYVCVCCVLY